MTGKEEHELYENICNDINCGTFILAPQYVNKLLAKLEKENAELKNKIADIKANCDLAIEGRDVKVMELEKENERLTVSYETLKLHDEEEIGMLKSENAKLKETVIKMNNVITETFSNLTKAKEYIKKLLKIINDFQIIGVLYDTDTLKEAEQFLNSEVEK